MSDTRIAELEREARLRCRAEMEKLQSTSDREIDAVLSRYRRTRSAGIKVVEV